RAPRPTPLPYTTLCRSAERAVFGHDHLEVGIEVVEAWRLPEAIVEAVGWHHSEDLGPIAQAVLRAREEAWQTGVGDGVTTPAERSEEHTSELQSRENLV